MQDKLQSVNSTAGANSPYVVVQRVKALYMKYAKRENKVITIEFETRCELNITTTKGRV